MNIINRPEYIDKSIYDDAIQKYISSLKNIEGIISINTMGSIGSPGLSDIDVIVVVEDDFQIENSSSLSVKGIDDRLFIHGPIVIPRCFAEHFQYIIYATNTTSIHGPELLQNISDIHGAERRSLLLCYLIDFIESRYLQFASVEFTEQIDQRSWLARLWSITHSYAIFELLGLSLQQEFLDKLELIMKIREDWNRFKRIDDGMFIQAYHYGHELNTLMFKMALDLAYSGDSIQNDYLSSVQLGNKKIYFKNVDIPRYEVRNLKVGRKVVVTCKCYQYKKYARHLEGYGFLSVGEDISGDLLLHYSVMAKRKNYVSKHWQWLNKHALHANSMGGYLGLKEDFTFGPKSTLKQLLEKISLGLDSHIVPSFLAPKNTL